LTVLTEMYISLATSAVFSMPDTCTSTSRSPLGERLDYQDRLLIAGWCRNRELAGAEGRAKQAPVVVGQFGVACSTGPSQLRSVSSGSLSCFAFGQPQRGGQGAATPRSVTAA
jgi:hypothetical protein